MFSEDGFTFTETTVQPGWWSPKLAFGDRRFVLYGDGSALAITDDASTWLYGESSASTIRWIDWLGDRFVGEAVYDCCFGELPDRIVELRIDSTDGGETWTFTPGDIKGIVDLAQGSGRFVAATYGGLLSGDSLESLERIGDDLYFTSVEWGGGRFVAVGSSFVRDARELEIHSSADGITWERN
jgi:hypothetical protein